MKISTLKKSLTLVLLASMSLGIYAQADVDSPYSRFGLGQIRNKTMNTRLRGMGGVSNAMWGAGMINAANPASYAKIDTLSFLFDAGVYAKTSTFSTTALSEESSNASLDYVATGFSVTKWWKMAIGAQPFSDIGYNVVVKSFDDNIGSYATAFNGSGGLNQVFWGNGLRLNKNFSFGFNGTYVFGDMLSTTTLYFPDSSYMINTRRGTDIMVSSFMLDYGFLYNGNLGNGYVLSIGTTYNQKMKLSGKEKIFIRSIEGGVGGVVEYVIDTIFYQSKGKTTFTMPHGLGFGVALQKDNRWTLGADFNWSNWKGFEIGGVNDSLQNSWNVSVGGEYNPRSTSVSNYWTKLSYRLGGFYEQTYLNIYGHSINKYGVTMGVTLPLPKSMSKVNLGLEFGQVGTKSAGLIQERYVNFTLGVSIYERWFLKRKYK
jgi:Long-chain fatty acid transport protein